MKRKKEMGQRSLCFVGIDRRRDECGKGVEKGETSLWHGKRAIPSGSVARRRECNIYACQGQHLSLICLERMQVKDEKKLGFRILVRKGVLVCLGDDVHEMGMG